jgi:hypothetical protein
VALLTETDSTLRNPSAHKAFQMFVCGKKGTGKTELAYLMWESYPYDRLLIDPNNDIKIPDNIEVIDLDADNLPSRWPVNLAEKKKARTLRFVPDFGNPGYLEQIDHCLGLAYVHGKTCVLVDEAHEAIPANRTPPHFRRALRQGRHRDLTLIMATPRPMTIDPLAISNADWTYVFKLNGPADRKRVAENIDWNPQDFDQAIAELREHEYLRYDAGFNGGEGDLAHFPALPKDQIRHHHG